MLARITILEKIVNNLMELENTAQGLCKYTQVSIAELIKQNRYQRLKINPMK